VSLFLLIVAVQSEIINTAQDTPHLVFESTHSCVCCKHYLLDFFRGRSNLVHSPRHSICRIRGGGYDDKRGQGKALQDDGRFQRSIGSILPSDDDGPIRQGEPLDPEQEPLDPLAQQCAADEYLAAAAGIAAAPAPPAPLHARGSNGAAGAVSAGDDAAAEELRFLLVENAPTGGGGGRRRRHKAEASDAGGRRDPGREDAGERLRRAAALEPASARAQCDYGAWLRGAMRRPAEAAAAYRRAVELDPGYAPALNNYACLLDKEREREMKGGTGRGRGREGVEGRSDKPHHTRRR
jgi:tetratricopeptide (TPR) repeat protein